MIIPTTVGNTPVSSNLASAMSGTVGAIAGIGRELAAPASSRENIIVWEVIPTAILGGVIMATRPSQPFWSGLSTLTLGYAVGAMTALLIEST